MFDTLKRLQLQRRGLSCGKARRKHGDNDFARTLRTSPWIKAAFFLAFLVGLWSLIASGGEEGTLYSQKPLASLVASLVLFLAAVVHFFVNHPRNFVNNLRILFIFGAVFLQLVLIKILLPMAEGSGQLGGSGYLYIPYALAPMLVTVLIGRNVGLFANVVTGIFAGFLLPLAEVFPFLVINFACGFIAVFFAAQIRRRALLVRTGLRCGLAAALGCFLFGFLEFVHGEGGAVLWGPTLWQAAVPVLVGIATGLLIVTLLPLLERLFQATSNISWVELSDLNHPLLRRLSIEAPGTYHHSLMVAHLAEAAAEAIGANVTLCRVCSYFHDIGKLNKPGYFIENIGGGMPNPHDELTPNMSAIVIMAHVKDGVDLALKHRLNDDVIDAIEQHHGTSLILYFYNKALARQAELEGQAEEGKIAREDVPEVDESWLPLPPARPQTREGAIISLSDALESASRSLEKPTPQRVEQFVEDIIRGRLLDGQLDQSDLTIQELAALRASFTKTLRSVLHSRISYRTEEDAILPGLHLDEPVEGQEPGGEGKPRRKTDTLTRGDKARGKKANKTASIGAV